MFSSWEREGNEAEAHGDVLGGVVLAGVEGRRRIPAKKRRNRRRSRGRRRRCSRCRSDSLRVDDVDVGAEDRKSVV